MSSVATAFERARPVLARVAVSRRALALAFVLVHLVLAWLALVAPGNPMGDVTRVYHDWVERGRLSGQWVGIDLPWVYPILALPPMLIASIAGTEHIGPAWMLLVALADAALFALLIRGARTPREIGPAWWWLAFLLALGPITMGRLDALAVAAGAAGLLVLARRPVLAGVLLAVATWIKVWPAVLVAIAFVTSRDRWRVVLGGGTVTAAVLSGMAGLGSLGVVFSFLTAQADRGLQIESVLATPWMWAAAAGHDWAVVFDYSLLTYQLVGPGVDATAALATPLLVIAGATVLGVAVAAVVRRAPREEVLVAGALALTSAMIVANKVGSPQFTTWLAAPVLLGLVLASRGRIRSMRTPAVLALVSAALTQLVYPYLYDELVTLHLAQLFVLTARNVVDTVLFLWALVMLIGLAMRGDAPPEEPAAVTGEEPIGLGPLAPLRPAAPPSPRRSS